MNGMKSTIIQHVGVTLFFLISWVFVLMALATPATTSDLLTFIRALEAPRGYNDYERRIGLAPPQPLTQMRLREVLEWQKRVRTAGYPSTAAGGYQIIHATLKRLITTYHIDRDVLFHAKTQDRLAQYLIAECGPRPAQTDRSQHPAFANCLAGVWAALPVTSGRDRGYSAYRHVAGNKALTTPATVLALLAGQKVSTPLPDPKAQPPRQSPRPLAFGAVHVVDAHAMMRRVQGSDDLTPSVHHWTFDPYASQ